MPKRRPRKVAKVPKTTLLGVLSSGSGLVFCFLAELGFDLLQPEWTREEVLEFPGSVDGPWAGYVDPESVKWVESPHPGPLPEGEGGKVGIGTVRYPRIVPRDEECARDVKKRTLTNLYNQRPTWLDLAHKKLDEAVFAAYNWDPGTSDEQLLAKLLELNLQRASEQT